MQIEFDQILKLKTAYQQSLINDQTSDEILRKRSSIFITDDSVDSYISEKYVLKDWHTGMAWITNDGIKVYWWWH